jgi:hypothetical protein
MPRRRAVARNLIYRRGVTEFDDAADELYGLPAEEFIAARDARAKAAADPGSAAAIKKLRRPSRSAWLANALVRKEKVGIDELLTLGVSMREAQLRLDGDELRTLTGQRRTAVAKLVQRAKEISGQEISESIVRELEGILGAAVASEEAADELAAGRLSTAVAADGGAPLMWSGGGAQVIPLRPRQKQQRAEPESAPPAEKRHMRVVPGAGSDERRAAEVRRLAEKELGTAQQAFDQADATADKAREAAENAATARKEAGRRIVELTAALEAAQQERTAADREVRITGRERDNAQRLADRARRRLDRAQATLDQLDE